MVSAPRLKLKLVLGDDDTLLGPGKIALLKAIQREQSLSKAAKSINMSYRRAWLLIQEQTLHAINIASETLVT